MGNVVQLSSVSILLQSRELYYKGLRVEKRGEGREGMYAYSCKRTGRWVFSVCIYTDRHACCYVLLTGIADKLQ